ncbi:hypothetical protein [Pandoravirus japonicus]|uniref:Uncharacterized protein n=1 Tax=Pandoravirus japonicus TaxID=2823154 RepID=A0A811BS55_9VIRU|nr:hypothetical protein [Pandoravirus japonicus]
MARKEEKSRKRPTDVRESTSICACRLVAGTNPNASATNSCLLSHSGLGPNNGIYPTIFGFLYGFDSIY